MLARSVRQAGHDAASTVVKSPMGKTAGAGCGRSRWQHLTSGRGTRSNRWVVSLQSYYSSATRYADTVSFTAVGTFDKLRSPALTTSHIFIYRTSRRSSPASGAVIGIRPVRTGLRGTAIGTLSIVAVQCCGPRDVCVCVVSDCDQMYYTAVVIVGLARACRDAGWCADWPTCDLLLRPTHNRERSTRSLRLSRSWVVSNRSTLVDELHPTSFAVEVTLRYERQVMSWYDRALVCVVALWLSPVADEVASWSCSQVFVYVMQSLVNSAALTAYTTRAIIL